ncbi:MAG: glutathione S-transferase N-terminal domain-containing protein [Cellvibrionaceae bacterium]|nr:glutathione S-transferase N-terminal domain-containing protein [Cellvibrionaceae bacterium]
MIDLYTAKTPNGHKVSCTLEYLGLEYRVKALDLLKGEQKSDDFLAINPNGRIHAIVDHEQSDDGSIQSNTIFESGAIMIYLAEKTGRLLPQQEPQRSQVMQWLMFQMSGVGPMMGQANVFYRYYPEKIPQAISRYQNECRRLFEVLDGRLAQEEWLAGDFSLADIANWCWVKTYKWSGVSIEGLENLDRWLKAIRAMPEMERGISVPNDETLATAEGDKHKKFANKASGLLQK